MTSGSVAAGQRRHVLPDRPRRPDSRRLSGTDWIVNDAEGTQYRFVNDDDVSGVESLSEDRDDRTPGILRFTRRLYEDALLHGVRWLRPSSVETGHRSTDGTVTLSSTTQYTVYERDVCPTVVITATPSGQLISSTALASVAAMPDELHCLARSQSLLGTHADSSLDFHYLVDLARNDLGQVTRVTQFDPAMHPLVLQDVAYDANHRLASISVPGRGTTFADHDALGRLTGFTDPLGVVTRAGEIDPASDALLALETLRPGANTAAFFEYDGRERLQASWDNVSGASPARPLVAHSYQDPTNTFPGRIDTQTLADAITGTSRTAVALLAADGTPLVEGVWLGDGFSLGTSSITYRNTRAHRRAFVGAVSESALAAFTSAELRALGTPLVDTLQAGFGHATESTTTQQAGVVGTVTTELELGAAELVSRVHQPGGFTAESASDAAGRLVRKTDENGVVHRYAYDALDRLVRLDTPDGAHTIVLDGFGRPSRVTRAGVSSLTYAYHAVTGLLVRKQHLDASGSVVDTSDIAHDATGRPIHVAQATSSAASDLRFDYDGQLDGDTQPGQLGYLSRVRGDGWERSQLFDPLGRLHQQRTTLTGWRDVVSNKVHRADGSVASDTVTITGADGGLILASTKETVLDGLGRVGALKVDGTLLYTLSYDGEGRLARADFASGEAIVFDHDPVTHRRRGHHIDAPDASGGVRWDHDPRGLIAAETYVRDGTETRRDYLHDGRGALIRTTTGSDLATYTYTPSGLPDSISDVAGSRTVHRVSSTLSVGGVPYTWDTAGRLVSKGEWSYEYGPSGQLTRASRPGRQVDYLYDDHNLRLLKRVDGVPARADVAGGVLTEGHFVELVTIGGVVAGVLDNAQFTALLTDPRGTPFAGPDGTPNLATAYGVRTAHLGLAEVIDYARLGWDPDLDAIRMGVRDYDPRLGQFLTPDPLYLENLEECRASPLQCALYGYAGGNPISFVDPTGLGFWSFVRNLTADTIDAAATVVGGVAGGAGGFAAGTPTGPGAFATAAGGAVLGAGLARGIVSPVTDLVRGETPSVQRQLIATVDGMTAEMGGQVLIKVLGATISQLRAIRNGNGTSTTGGGSSLPKADIAAGGGRYVPRDPAGTPLPLPRRAHGQLSPSSADPHTQIGWHEGRRGGYIQTREFGPDGKPVKQVDWTDHGRPARHTNPHVHDYVPNPTGGTMQHGKSRPPRDGEL